MSVLATHAMGRPVLFASLALAGFLVAGRAETLPAENRAATFTEWQILDAKASHVVGFEDLMADLLTADVIYIGEEHSHRSHIEATLRILQALVDRNRKPALGLEMFGWDGQAALDHYLAEPDMASEQFLKEANWKENWGGAYTEYAPLIDLDRFLHLHVLALS